MAHLKATGATVSATSRPYSGRWHVQDQLTCLRNYWPKIRCNSRCSLDNLLKGRMVMVSLLPEFLEATYGGAVEKVLRHISVDRDTDVVNHLELELLRESDIMKSRLPRLLERHLDSHALVFVAQPGTKTRNITTSLLRETLSQDEFPFGVLDVALSLLTHPQLLSGTMHAGLVCARDVYFEDVQGKKTERVPVFVFDEEDQKIHLESMPVDGKDSKLGFPIGYVE